MRTDYFTCLRRKRKYCRIIQHYITMLREKKRDSTADIREKPGFHCGSQKKHTHG